MGRNLGLVEIDRIYGHVELNALLKLTGSDERHTERLTGSLERAP